MPEVMTEQEQREAWLAIGYALACVDSVRKREMPDWGSAALALGREMERLRKENVELQAALEMQG
jgi:hypothetical protein